MQQKNKISNFKLENKNMKAKIKIIDHCQS